MRLLALVAVLHLLLAGSLVTSGLAATCAPEAPYDALRRLQDDGQSGGDAGDCEGDATTLPRGTYHWATLDAAAVGGLDGHDWFRADLAAELGVGSWAMVNVTGDLLSYYSNYAAGTALPEVPVVLEAYAPGASVPFAVLHSCGVGADFAVEPGLYRFHVFRAPLASSGPCVDGAPYPPTGGPPEPQHNYGVYYGCHPHCRKPLVLG